MVENNIPSEVTIREVGPREGFQIHPVVVPTTSKLALINALVDAGLQEIEVASFVRPDRVPTMADAAEVVAALPHKDDVAFTALYLNQKGFARAEEHSTLRNKGWLYTSPSASFLKTNSNTTLEQSLAEVPEWVELFKKSGKELHGLMISTAFGCGIEGEITTTQVEGVVRRYVDECSKLGVQFRELCLADTIGVANPRVVRESIRALRSFGCSVSLHLHNTWGLGITNTYAGLLEGVSIFETSVGGMGGCPFTPGASGNVATEDVVYLCGSLGIKTGIDLNKVCKAGQLAESLLEKALPGQIYQAWKHSGQKLPFTR